MRAIYTEEYDNKFSKITKTKTQKYKKLFLKIETLEK
jgi:hypothetical protein